MATIVVTMRIMPDAPDTDLDAVTSAATEKIAAFGGTVGKTDQEPVAFGLKAIVLMFTMDEAKGSTDALETQISSMGQVASVQITDVRRTIG
jgi:elongation factor 1-beta